MLLFNLNFFISVAVALSNVRALGRRTYSGSSRRDAATDTPSVGARKLLLGGGPTGAVLGADFDGTSFNIVANNTVEGTSASWLLFKEPNLLYAVDENSENTRLFNVSQF